FCNLKGDELKAYRYSMRYIDERKLEVECAVKDATIAVTRRVSRQVRKQASMQRSNEIAAAMLANGLKPAIIARCTKLPLSQISRLRASG
ncbi:MAG: hypothetical protein FWC26_00550, partial [Fibromonadales bacterium]|nr:hypothetical protein [Fibromonadales bacterium]